MANLRQLYNLVSTLKELKREFIGKTRSFVDDNFPSYNKFLNDLKEKCKSEIKTQNPDVDSEKKTVLEKLFGKKIQIPSSDIKNMTSVEKTAYGRKSKGGSAPHEVKRMIRDLKKKLIKKKKIINNQEEDLKKSLESLNIQVNSQIKRFLL